MCIKINKIGKQEVGIWWVQKRFPRYEVPIWSLWPNIRFLPSIVAEKNEHIAILWETFLDPSDSYFLFADLVGFYTHWTYMHIFHHIFLSNYWWQRSDIWLQASYKYPILWEVFLDPSDSYFQFADFVDFWGDLCFFCPHSALKCPGSSQLLQSPFLTGLSWIYFSLQGFQ
jgi:hypothetical protein